jgi:hypothetical protein
MQKSAQQRSSITNRFQGINWAIFTCFFLCILISLPCMKNLGDCINWDACSNNVPLNFVLNAVKWHSFLCSLSPTPLFYIFTFFFWCSTGWNMHRLHYTISLCCYLVCFVYAFSPYLCSRHSRVFCSRFQSVSTVTAAIYDSCSFVYQPVNWAIF